MQASDVNKTLSERRRSFSQGSAQDVVVQSDSSYSKIRGLLRRKPQLTREGIHDIDKNLHFREGEYNLGLGEAFKSKKVTRNVFCTDIVTFTQSDIRTRCEVRDFYAKKYNFKTYAIITPSDYAWHLDSKILSDFFMECLKAGVDLRTKKNLSAIDKILENPVFESIALLIKPKKTPEEMEKIFAEQVPPGTTFERLEGYYSTELADKALHAKWITDIAAMKAELTGIKGLALRKFFNDNKNSVCSFAFTDDKHEEVEAVVTESAKWPNARVTGIITPADIKECTKKYYEGKLDAHLNRSSKTSSDEDAASQRNSGSVTPPAGPIKNKSRSAGHSPEEQLPLSNSSSSLSFGKMG
jgi:hypothetical protein